MPRKNETQENDSQDTQPPENEQVQEAGLSPMEYYLDEEGNHRLLDKHIQDGEVMGVTQVFHPSRLDVMKARALAYGYELREVNNG